MTILICILYGVAGLIGFLGLITWATHFSRKDVDQHRRDPACFSPRAGRRRLPLAMEALCVTV